MQKQDQAIAISVEDFILHTQESPFSGIDPTCSRHKDRALPADAVNDGFLTPHEASLVSLHRYSL
jgi:hypothetical protein